MSLVNAPERALSHLLSQQGPRGDWEGEMVWCPIITAQYVIVREVTGRPLDERARAGLSRHFEVTRTPEGGWGLHPESPSYVFVTALAYVALRLLGLSRRRADAQGRPRLARAAAGRGAGHSDLGEVLARPARPL